MSSQIFQNEGREGCSVRKKPSTGTKTATECTVFSNSSLFKRKQTSGWNFVIEQTLHLGKELENVSDTKRMENWPKESTFTRLPTHDVEPYLDPKPKATMNRNREFKFIVRHNKESPSGPVMGLKNDIGDAICRAREAGRSTENLVNAMETMAMVANLHEEDQ